MTPNSGWKIELEQKLPGQVMESMLRKVKWVAGLFSKVPIMQLYRCFSLVGVAASFSILMCQSAHGHGMCPLGKADQTKRANRTLKEEPS
jgi:hypothetical protein